MDLREDLKGKNILVTGATSGIGKAIVLFLVKCGAYVIMTARNEEKMLSINRLYPENTCYIAADLENMEEIVSIFAFLQERKIKLDGLAHSAGITLNQPLKAHERDDMQRVMQVNVYSFVELVKYFGRKKAANEGAGIVVISSIISLTQEKGLLSYTASKAAVNAAVTVMAKELLRRRIRVNAILPGNVGTEMFENQKRQIEDFETGILKKQPLGIIDAQEVAHLAGYLLSSYARYMTGLCLPMDAGYLLKEEG